MDKLLEKKINEKIINGLCHGILAGTIVFTFVLLFMFFLPTANPQIAINSILFFAACLYFSFLSMNYREFFNKKIIKTLENTKHYSVMFLIVTTYSSIIILSRVPYENVLILINVFSLVIFYYINFKTKINDKWIINTYRLYTGIVFIFGQILMIKYINHVKILWTTGIFFYLCSLIVLFVVFKRWRHVLWHFFCIHGAILHYVAFIVIYIKFLK